MLATTFAEAAGVSGRQKWGLVLSSSARVSQVTYQTVVGVRYPELVTHNGTQWKFGKYVQQESPLPGGFLPIFWDVPRANIHAVEDIGAVVDWLLERRDFQPDAKSNLAVLHNRNDMTNLFRASNWVSSSNDSIVSRGVTTCAGMTAHTVLLARTKVEFLTGGRKKSFRLLSEEEQMVQLEEAYARATVAITRARSLCLIMGPLDMKGLLGAATVMGTLMYGAGHVWEGQAHFYLHDGELSRSPPDGTFIHMLQQNCILSGPHFPPPAIVEALQDYVTHYYKVRRLHLIVVDLWRPWKYNTDCAKAITDQLWYTSHCDDTHRVSPFRPDGPKPPLRCRRFAYGYALDGSECPSYLVWPQREGHSYAVVDTFTNDTLPLNQEFFRPWAWNISMMHSYWSLKSVSVGKPCACLACEKMNCWEVQASRIAPSASLASLHEVAKCLTMKLAVHLAKEVAAILRAVLTHETKKLYNDSTVHLFCSNYWIQPIYQELLHSSSRRNATRECERKRPSSGLARLLRMPNHPNNGDRRLLARVSVTGLEVPVMRIPYKSGSLPTGPLWCCNSCKRRRTDTVLRTRLGWTRKWLQWTLPSNGRKLGLTAVCSSRSAIIGMAPGKATSGCLQAPLKLTGYSCQLSNTLPRSLH